MVGVVVKQRTARLEYALDFVFTERGKEYTLLSAEEALNFDGHLLSYGIALNDGTPRLEASELLFEEEIGRWSPEKIQSGEIDCLAFNGVGDLLASIFYVLSRYEEYESGQSDTHGRFPADASLQTAFGWLDKAVCDRWAEHILHLFGVEGTKRCRIVPSFDIDNTYAYRYKDGWRAQLSYLKDLKNQDFERMRERKAVRKGAKDPYDTFELIQDIQNRFPQTRIFWLVAPLGEKDRNLSAELEVHQGLMRRMDVEQSLGLHPGYVSNSRVDKIRAEKAILEKALGRTVNASRQHFLRFRLPQTYKALIENGFTDEYSMGFAELPGFRAGTARPFNWFDLDANEKTSLRIHPFVYMDGTLNEYLGLSIDESKERIAILFDEVKRFGGDFVCIWHNETIGDYRKWKGWSAVLNYTLNLSE